MFTAKEHAKLNTEQPVRWWEVGLLILLYVLFARVGQIVAIPPGNVTPFWPAAGIIVIAVILKGYRIWPGIWLGAMLGNGWVYADFATIQSTANSLLAAGLNGSGDTLCALFGYYMLSRTGEAKDFIYSSRAVLHFIAYAAITGSIISASFGVTGLCLAGFLPWDAYLYTWITWSIGDGAGILVVVPILTSLKLKKLKNIPRQYEAITFLILVTVYIYFNFGFNISDTVPNYLTAYIVFPVLVWSSYRYGGCTTYLIGATISIIAIAHTSLGRGIFYSDSINSSLIELQTFVASVTITSLFLNAVIYERSHIMRLLKKTNTALETANREMKEFSYSLSHDLKTPARAVISFAQLLKDDSGNIQPQQHDYLQRIINAGKRMVDLIDDVITLSMISNQTLVKVELDICKISQNIGNSLKNDHPDRHIDLRIQENMTGYADKKLMNIVLLNLIGNAWKYTEKQQAPVIEIKTEFIDNTETFVVCDNGTGFDNQYKDKLFNVFQRLHTENEFSGTGIGLAIVKRIIHRHGGKVWAEGKQGRGACFYFTLNQS